jgi:hypothetical protein
MNQILLQLSSSSPYHEESSQLITFLNDGKDIKVTMTILNNVQENDFRMFFGQLEIVLELKYICRRELLSSKPLQFRIKFNTVLPIIIQTLSKQIKVFAILLNVISFRGCQLLDCICFEVFVAVIFQIVFLVAILYSFVAEY